MADNNDKPGAFIHSRNRLKQETFSQPAGAVFMQKTFS